MCLLSNQVSGLFDHQNLRKESIYILVSFLMELVIKRMEHLWLPLLTGCDQLCFTANRMAGSFSHQYFWKESIYILIFLYKNSHQGKTESETTFFGYVCPSAPIIQSSCRIVQLSISLKWINQDLRLFCIQIIIKGRKHLRLPL